MTHIKRVNESIYKNIDVIDIEDILQPVWDKYREIIDGYVIKRNFIDSDFVLYTGDQLVSMGNDIEYMDNIKRDDQKYEFDIVIDISEKMHSQMGDWGESGFFDTNNFINLISSIKKYLSPIYNNTSISFDSEGQSPELEITISFIL